MQSLPKFGVELHRGKLANGAEVFLFKRKGMPIHMRAVFFAGSRFDIAPGSAHFLEHMILAGTEKFPSKNLIADHIQKVGGDFGARTNNNLLIFNVEIPEAEDLGIGIEVMKECLTKSLFSNKSIENERGAIYSEIRSKKSNPKEYVWEVSRKLYLQGTPAGNSTLGDDDEVASITKADLLQHKENFMHSGRVAFVVSGDVDMKDILTNLDSIPLPIGEKLENTGQLPIIREETTSIEQYDKVNQLQVQMTMRTSIESHKEYCALKTLNELLSSGRGSRLVTKLRYENGLVYTISGGVINTIDWGVMRIQFSCDASNLSKVKEIISEEFKQMKNGSISEEDLDNVKSKISKGAIRQLQTSESWVNFHENDCIFTPQNLKTAEDYIKESESLTLTDIKMVIEKYLDPGNFYTAICGDYIK